MFGDVYNTTVNYNGQTMYSSTFYPGRCCCGGYNMNSCFGFGFGGMGNGIGTGLGFALGMAAIPVLPALFKGIGKAVSWVAPKIWSGISWLGSNIGKGAAWLGKNIGKGAAWLGKNIAKGAAWVGKTVAKGVSSLWNKIFHKKSKTKSEKAE